MTSYCLTYIEDSMTIYYIIHNGTPLKFYMNPDSFKEYFRDRKSFYMITKNSDIELIDTIDDLCHTFFGPYSDSDSDKTNIYNDPLAQQFIETTFKDPDTFLKMYVNKKDIVDIDDLSDVESVEHTRSVISDDELD